MRISDWSSDVCSSDLGSVGRVRSAAGLADVAGQPAAHRHGLSWQAARGARIPAPAGRARAAHLGRDGVDPVQPAPTTGATAMTESWTTLVDARTLAAALEREDLVILDCRFSLAAPDAGQAAYAASHLPGALYAHLDRDLSDHRKPGGGRHPWPDAADFDARLGDWRSEEHTSEL